MTLVILDWTVSLAMPMIDLYAPLGTFAEVHELAVRAAYIAKTVEQVPDIPMFRSNTAAFVHELHRRRSRMPRAPPTTCACRC